MITEENSDRPRSSDEILIEHLGYAADLVALSLRELTEPSHVDLDREWYRRMSSIEVVWAQARILVEFFTGALASATTAAAKHFTTRSLQYQFPNAERLKAMRNDQIAHMNYARTTNPEQKLQATDMHLTASAINLALKLFVCDLKPHARKIWEARVSGRLNIEADLVYKSIQAVSTATLTGSFASRRQRPDDTLS